MSALDNFQDWKDFLSARVNQAERLGMNQETVGDIAYQIGDYLAKQFDPKNDSERLLKDLWDVASEEEQRTVANLMVKLVSDGNR
jgi:hypothetical protein